MPEPLTITTQAAPPAPGRAPVEPMDPRVDCIQPGGGVCIRIEQAWGRVRRWSLRTFRPGYVEKMRGLRRGDRNACPHEVLDPRDVKFHRNQEGYWWPADVDPFQWRDRLPFARVGLAELWLLGGGLAALAVGLGFVWWPLAIVPAVLAGLVAWFFRNPRRRVPTQAGLVVAPADGKIVALEELAHDDFLQGPALKVGIFLSIFNVHINRTPVAARVIGLTYRPGKFLNALAEASIVENEQLAVRLEEAAAPHRRMIVRQIAGLFARRIVCWVKPGDTLDRGAQFGMIKLGSRTELVLPREPGLRVLVRMGQSVTAGDTVLAQYEPQSRSATAAEHSPSSAPAERDDA